MSRNDLACVHRGSGIPSPIGLCGLGTVGLGRDSHLFGMSEGLVAGHFDADEGAVGLGDLGHFGFDALEIVGADGVVEVDVVVETVFDGGAVDELGFGPEAADGFGHDVGAAMAHGVDALGVAGGDDLEVGVVGDVEPVAVGECGGAGRTAGT